MTDLSTLRPKVRNLLTETGLQGDATVYHGTGKVEEIIGAGAIHVEDSLYSFVPDAMRYLGDHKVGDHDAADLRAFLQDCGRDLADVLPGSKGALLRKYLEDTSESEVEYRVFNHEVDGDTAYRQSAVWVTDFPEVALGYARNQDGGSFRLEVPEDGMIRPFPDSATGIIPGGVSLKYATGLTLMDKGKRQEVEDMLDSTGNSHIAISVQWERWSRT